MPIKPIKPINVYGPAHLAPRPAEGLAFDSRGVLAPAAQPGEGPSLPSIRAILAMVQFPGYEFFCRESGGRIYIQARFHAPHCKTGEVELQHTRKWYVSNWATRSEVVQTALKLVLTSVEHEAREAFKYRGRAIFGPHFNVDALHSIADQLDERSPAAK